jgi:cob(I)alamin adenosyltransferase
MSIYTRTGDTGTTALFKGKRVLKCEELVEVYGSIDELNSWIGLIASYLENPDVAQFLYDIQKDLFTIGSTLAGWDGDLSGLPGRVKEMEARIDVFEDKLPKLNKFILPGGTPVAAHLHIARAVARRVERQMVNLAQSQNVSGEILTYINRLSDLLFMVSRFINYESGIREVPWHGVKRDPK